MSITTFLFYFIVFIFVFSSPSLHKRFKGRGLLLVVGIPAVLALVMMVLTIIKVYVIYKLWILVFAGVTVYLSYLEWGRAGRRK